MDVASLKAQASTRRTSTISTFGWRCQYCKKTFQNEKVFLKHICKEKQRLEELKTPNGQAAYSYYCIWLKFQKFSVPPIDTFSTSRQYRAFINFAKYSIRLNLQPDAFIKLMIKNDIEPVLWCRDAVYSLYLEQYDRIIHPLEQAVNSIDHLQKIANKEDISLAECLYKLGFKHVLEQIRLRKISPWLLFNSNVCTTFFRSLDPDDITILEGVINTNAWSERIAKHREDCKLIQAAASEIGL